MDNLHTSQQKAGEHQLGEGRQSASAPDTQYGLETTGAPGPVTEPIKGEIIKIDALQTSQQKAGEYSDPASK